MEATLYSSERPRSYKKSYTFNSDTLLSAKELKYTEDFHKIPKVATMRVVNRDRVHFKDTPPPVSASGLKYKYVWTWYETKVT